MASSSTTRSPSSPGETSEPDGPSGYIVRYGSTRMVSEYTSRRTKRFERGEQVIVRSDRGLEWGEILCDASVATRHHLKISQPLGKIVREVSRDDEQQREELRSREKDEFDQIGGLIAERRMQMQLVDVEHLFGGERIVVYYLAENRVDFRELVKTLARTYKTRIEMRQIGVRDEAKLLADYGDCGKPVCCNTHLRQMPPVSMRMAKIQKATLDPTKISGRCGRLKCCLRYEFDTYEESHRELPPMNATVVTKVGQGRVVGRELLARKVVVEYDRTRRVITDPSEILTVVKKPKQKSGKGPSKPSKAPYPKQNQPGGEEKKSSHPDRKSGPKNSPRGNRPDDDAS